MFDVASVEIWDWITELLPIRRLLKEDSFGELKLLLINIIDEKDFEKTLPYTFNDDDEEGTNSKDENKELDRKEGRKEKEYLGAKEVWGGEE